MELQIQDLVSSIRKEGVEAANAEAEAIIAEAKKKADSIVRGAQTEAQQYKDAAEKEINILKESAEVSADQAKRDAVLAFKTEIQNEIEKILSAGIGKELNGKALGTQSAEVGYLHTLPPDLQVVVGRVGTIAQIALDADLDAQREGAVQTQLARAERPAVDILGL